ncbi:hypothetical protein C8J56DRAFT_899617 [Mycena floridula]|nr:hypothetical protein C8J56DRAFT_899617 [Mycena floridula]
MRQSQRLKAKLADVANSDEEEVVPVKKTLKKTNKPKQNKRSGRLRLLLPTMPLDILFEVGPKMLNIDAFVDAFQIFGFLDPKDLSNLAKVNRACHDGLVAENASFAWRRSRQRHEAPAPIIGFSEMAWASFLFGAGCQAYMWDGCTWSEYRNREFDASILDLVPFTGQKKHLLKVQAKVAELEKALADGRLDARKNLEEYKFERLELVDQVRKNRYGTFVTQREEDRIRREARATEVGKRFYLLGYDYDDMQELDHESMGKGVLTDHIWGRLRQKYEPIIRGHRDRRLLELRQYEIKTCFKKLYLQHLETIAPTN